MKPASSSANIRCSVSRLGCIVPNSAYCRALRSHVSLSRVPARSVERGGICVGESGSLECVV